MLRRRGLLLLLLLLPSPHPSSAARLRLVSLGPSASTPSPLPAFVPFPATPPARLRLRHTTPVSASYPPARAASRGSFCRPKSPVFVRARLCSLLCSILSSSASELLHLCFPREDWLLFLSPLCRVCASGGGGARAKGLLGGRFVGGTKFILSIRIIRIKLASAFLICTKKFGSFFGGEGKGTNHCLFFLLYIIDRFGDLNFFEVFIFTLFFYQCIGEQRWWF